MRTEGSVGRYFQEIGKYPIISAEEEAELAVRIREGDDAAKEKLIQSNLRFVVSVAKQYQNQGLTFPDLINEGNLGLVKAAGKFDETRGFKFISYAVWWIRQSIIQAISGQTRIVRLPLNRINSIQKISKAIPLLEQEYEREPTDDEIAGFLEMSRTEVSLINGIKKLQMSLDAPLSHERDSDFSLYDLVQTGNIPSPDNNLMHESVSINVKRILNKLTKREASILAMSFGLGGSPVSSLQEIGLKHHITSERVRQIKSQALFRLKIMIGDNDTITKS